MSMRGLLSHCYFSIPSSTSHISVRHPVHPSYQATGGYLREEAIMILRRFYVTENTNGMSCYSR